MEYISEGQPSLYELVFRIELGPNPKYKMVSEPLTANLPYYPCNKPNSVGREGCIGKKHKSQLEIVPR